MKKNPRCSLYDLRALEVWYAKLAADGLELTDDWQEFREGEKREKQFYIEPAEENAEPSQSLRDSRALMGWEYVCSMDNGAFYIWRSVNAAANPPRSRELAGSWADKRLGRELLWWWLAQLGSLGLIVLGAFLLTFRNDMPVWTLLTDGSDQMHLLTLALGLLCGFWATRRDFLALGRLRRAVRAGEYEAPVAQHTVWYELMRWLPIVIAVLLLLPFFEGRDGDFELREQPFLSAGELGGEAGERHAEARNTPLCDLTLVQEGDYADWISRKNWFEYDSQLEIYRPRFGLLAKPLTQEFAQHFNMAQAEALDGMEAYYAAADGVQRMLLRDGGRVLFYRTDAPDDLRRHMGDFAALAEACR